MKLSCVILAKNEEKNIKECIESVFFCNEILVIDDESTDNTGSIAKKLGAKVIVHPLHNDFAKQRNFAMSQASGDWILFVDADERVSPALKKEILTVISQTNPQNHGYYIKRIDNMWGKFLQYGETGNLYLLRLAQKGQGVWYGKVHENWIATGKSDTLQHPLLHYPH